VGAAEEICVIDLSFLRFDFSRNSSVRVTPSKALVWGREVELTSPIRMNCQRSRRSMGVLV